MGCYGRRAVEFRILGPLEVLDGDRPVEIAGSKRRAVLALLLLHANEVVRTERLIDDLWGDHAPRNAAAALHSHVSRLRKALGPDVLVRREWGYVLRTNPDSFDLSRFERLVADAGQLPARERSAKLAGALQLWRGPALADLSGEEGLQTEIARLDELRLATLERRIDADLEAGRNADLVAEIEALVAAHPLRERLRGQLILALYRAGRQVEALEVYRETRRVLAEELGLEPSPDLRELERAILRQDPAIAVAAAPRPEAARSRTRSKRNGALLALLALSLVGLGVGGAIVFAGHNGRPAAAPANLAAGTTGTSTVAASTTHAATTHAQTIPRAAKPAQTTHSQRQRSEPRPVKHVVAAARSSSHTSAHRTGTKPTPTPAATTRAGAVKPKIVTISDNFADNQIDGTIWLPTRFGTGWTMTEQNSHLEFTFTPSTAGDSSDADYGGLVGTLCKFPGDFDAHVHFTLAEWPAGNGITAELASFLGPTQDGWGIDRRSAAQWGEQYSSYTATATSVQLDDLSGTLRIARRNGIVTAYFRHNGRWDTLTSGHNTGLAIIGVSAIGGPGYNIGPFGGQRVVVDFDHFSVTGSSPICPPGSEGSG